MNQKPIIEITVNENAVIHFELWPEIAPIACASVMRLAEKRIFDGRAIERLEPGFVLQPLFLMVLIHRSISWSNRNLKPILKMPKSFLNGGLLPWQEIQRTVLAASTISLLLLLRD
ncbi:MAG: peptidylprolyl isomerase [Blautia sp.]